MFEFYWPWMALLIFLPLLIKLYWARRQKNQSVEDVPQTLLHPGIGSLTAAFGKNSMSLEGSLLKTVLLALLWIALVIAMMRPQWLEPHTETITRGYDLMLAIDASHSMDALDFTVAGRQVSRMSVVKGVMSRFIQNRPNDRIGMIVFGSEAFLLSPLTLDTQAVDRILGNLQTNVAGQGTAMGNAIGLGVKKLRERPPGSRVLVLIADGENTAGTIPPLEAARFAAMERVRIYTIGVGSNKKEVPIMEGGRVIMRDDLGMDEEIMRQIAEITDGAYFRATNTNALEEIYQRIDQLEKTEAESRTVMIPTPLYRWPLGFALLILGLLGLFPEGQIRMPAWRTNA
jgi:Ca-activated chloride channel family protein